MADQLFNPMAPPPPSFAPQAPSAAGREPSRRTDTYTFVTQVGGNRLLYSAEDWVRVNLRLETAGPVVVSTREDVVPVLSGKGIEIPDDDDLTFVLPRGNRLFYSAESVNRVRFFVEPIPWLETLLRVIDSGFRSLLAALSTSRISRR
ncbi:MAG: hypothetical protein R3322_00015 [Kiloniellales bacterium]|nr:hypothetical protein [Kiloniellales bacterium]